MKKKAILVTGGAGFIGSHFVDRMMATTDRPVLVVDNLNDSYSPMVKLRNVSDHLSDPRFRLYRIDICDKAMLEKIFAGCEIDTIVHLAALAGVRPSIAAPENYVRTNVAGTLTILELAKRFGIGKLIFGSSSSVYGANPKTPFSENDPVASPISPYAATKSAGELLCHTYSHLSGIDCVCLRFFTVYGPRQRPDLAIHRFVRRIANGKAIHLFGDGKSSRDYTYIDDIINGIEAALKFRGSGFEVINLGGSEPVELSDLVRVIGRAMNVEPNIERLPDQPGDVRKTFADITKAKKLLGYRPATTIERGIDEFVRWFRLHARPGVASAARVQTA